MVEEIDDNEFFQQDFTTASEWEIFNARLDEVFHDWKLHLRFQSTGTQLKKNELFHSEWDIISEIIFIANVELRVSHYRIKNDEIAVDSPETQSKTICQSHIDLASFNNNFCTFDNIKNQSDEIHPLAVWYGLRNFIVIEPVNESIISESQFRILLSSACITVSETNTEIPVFVRVMEKEMNVFLGVCQSKSVRVNFDVIALESAPLSCRFLSGLLSMFKGKIVTNYVQLVMVSVRLTYILHDFVKSSFCIKSKIPFSMDTDDDSDDPGHCQPEGKKMFALPFGVSIDHISELTLNCTWPEIAENVIVDSSTYSDLDPMLAPVWSVRVNFKQKPIYYLTDSIGDFLKLAENTKTLRSILGSNYEFSGSQNFEGSNPLDLLTESRIPTIQFVLHKKKPDNKNRNSFEGPIKADELMQMLYYLFPDAQNDPEFPYEFEDHKKTFDCPRIKSALPDSLVLRLSSLLATCYSYFGGLSGLAQLWAEFTQEMRYRLERCIQIPGIGFGFPDSRTCLLHQKLQMLNICMERRRLREGGLPFSMSESKETTKPKKSEDSDDEFYDCDTATGAAETEYSHAPWNKPEGRLSQLDNLTLIDSNEALYVPVTQDSVPKTEDQLEDDANVMLQLGPGSELCSEMMSATLLSDMESFKAANPSGKLEDFIRWYSPRDWIVETDELGETSGRLSQRMLLPGNTWQVVWGQAKPVSAKRQRRLFDDTREGEKVLHFFETQNIGQICELIITPLFHSAILKIKDELICCNLFDCFDIHFDKITDHLSKLSREKWISKYDSIAVTKSSINKWQFLLGELTALEQLTLQSRNLAQKLFTTKLQLLTANEKDIISKLLNGFEADLLGGAKNPTSVNVLNLFSDARHKKNEFTIDSNTPSQLYLPEPIRKEYILRVSGKESNKGEGGPQFLRAILDKNMRLCGAFSENTTFV